MGVKRTQRTVKNNLIKLLSAILGLKMTQATEHFDFYSL